MMKTMRRLKQCVAYLLVAVMIFSTGVPSSVSATGVSSSTYSSRNYSVNGITAYAYDGSDLSQEGLTFLPMTDNKELAKALYYAYGSLGYSKEYVSFNEYFLAYEATKDTDKLAVSEMVLTKLMDADDGAYDDMTKDYLAVIAALPEYDSAVFAPYYILSADSEIVGYTSTSAEVYETPVSSEDTTVEASEDTTTEETNEDATTEEVSSESSEDSKEDVGIEATTEVSHSEEATENTTENSTEVPTEKPSEEKNFEKADRTYEDGIRNRNNGTLAKVLGENISQSSVLGEITSHWDDGTYLGQSEFKHYDFASTLLSNLSGKDIDKSVFEFAKENKLEVYQETGTVSEILFDKMVNGLTVYYSEGDIFVINDGEKQYTGVYVGMSFYDKHLESPNEFCFYEELEGYVPNAEQDVKNNAYAWIWHNGEDVVLEPISFTKEVTLSVIKLNREGLAISADGATLSSVLSDGATMTFNQTPTQIAEINESADNNFTANALSIGSMFDGANAGFSNDVTLVTKLLERVKHASYIEDWDNTLSAGDGYHARFYWRARGDSDGDYKHGEDKDCSSCVLEKDKGIDMNGDGDKNDYYCTSPSKVTNKATGDNKQRLIVCGKASLESISKVNGGFAGATMKIKSVGRGMGYSTTSEKYENCKLSTAKGIGDLIREDVLVNKSVFKEDTEFQLTYCRDNTLSVPDPNTASNKTGFYEIYLGDLVKKNGNLVYTLNILWYSEYTLLNETNAVQRLCGTFTVEQPAMSPKTPEKGTASVKIKKVVTSGTAGNLADGTYTFELSDASKTKIKDYSVTVTNGVSSVATVDLGTVFNYSKDTETAHGSVVGITYTPKISETFYLREISSPSGNIDKNRYVEIEVCNAGDYINYINQINDYNALVFSGQGVNASAMFSFPTPMVEVPVLRLNTTDGAYIYPNNETFGAAAFLKTVNNNCKNIVAGNENYSLEGAEYTVYTSRTGTQKALYYQVVHYDDMSSVGLQDAYTLHDPAEAVFTTDANGKFINVTESNVSALNGKIVMKPGTYYIEETKAPKGYKKTVGRQAFTITNGVYNTSVTLVEDVAVDPLKIQVRKTLTGGNAAVGDVTVAGVDFLLEFFEDAALSKKLYQATFTTDGDGKIGISKNFLKAGSSTFPAALWNGVDLNFPAGYIRVTEVNKDTNPSAGTLATGSIKWDGLNGSIDVEDGVVIKVEVGSTVLGQDYNDKVVFSYVSGGTITEDNDEVSVTSERPKRFDVCFTKKDEAGNPMASVPFVIENTTTGEKHLVVSDVKGYVTTKRTDLVFTSSDAEQGVALDSLKSESDPYYNSLDSYIADQTVDTLVNNELAPAPIWFYGTSEDVTKLDATVYADYQKERDTEAYHGSLIYAKEDTYTIYELDSKASNGKQLIKRGEITFGCDVDGKLVALTDGQLDATIINYNSPAIKTLSRDLSTQQKFSKQAQNVTIIDTFEVTNVKYNAPYTVKGVLVATRDSVINGVTYHAGELIKDTDGKYVTAHSSFTTGTTDKDGNTVDSKHYSSQKNNTYTSVDEDLTSARTSLIYTMNTLGFETCGAVWYTYLCEGIEDKDLVITDGVVDKEASNVIREWTISEENGYYDYVEDENLANESEFVEVVCIDTDAWTPVHKTNVQKADVETEIFDDVRINGLVEGETYTLVSKLIDPESGAEVIANDGNACVGLIDGATDTFTFTPDETGNHNLCVTYPKFDSTPYVGKSVVCFQYIYDANGILLGESTQLTNTRETVYFPEAYTTAMGTDDNKIIPQYGEITINDTVHYTGLATGKEYVVTGTLHYLDKDGVEQTVHYKDGTEVISSLPFTPEESTGDILVPFTFNIEDIKENVWDWEKTVVFEDISYNGVSVITHADITDKGQTVYFPSLHTSLREKDTGVQHLDTYDKDITLVDTVTYSNLEPGKPYRIIGKIVNPETGEVIKNNGKEVIATRMFTPQYNGEFFPAEIVGDNPPSEEPEKSEESSEETTTESAENEEVPSETPTEPSTEDNEKTNDTTEEESVGVSGSIEVVFTFNGKDAGLIAEDGHNAPIVAYEYLYDNFDLEAVGKDVSSEEETTEESSTESTTENEEQAEETPSVKIEIISTEENHTDIYSNVTLWSVHTDKTDVQQTITVPSGHTTLLDSSLKEHTSSLDEVITLVDTVAYRGLLPGKTYTTTGVLYIPKEQANEVELVLVKKDENGKECCPLLDENGQMIQGSTTFVAETADGSVDVTFTFKRSLITKEKSKVVAFEDMSYGEEGIVFTHADIEDSDQTVYFPSVHTTALSEDTRDHFAGAYITAKIIDSVQVGGLLPNREYKLIGTLMNQANGSGLSQDGLPIVAETVFETTTQDKVFNGTIDVTFSFDASVVKGKSAVVFEKLYLRKLDENGQKTDEWIEVGNHEDITDEGQTVHFSDLRTKASEKDTGEKKVDAKKKLQIVDTVTYKNLIPGKEYTITGMIMVIPEGVKASDLDTVEIKDGKTLADYAFTYDAKKNVYIDENGYKCTPLKVDGEPVTSTKTFTPTEPNGTVDVVFTIDASKLAGQTLVVFEDLYVNDIKVGTHANITDKGQTIKIETDTPGDDTPSIETGDTFPLIPMIILAVIFFAGIVGLTIGRKKFLKK